jgi:ABC-type multidrug transport system ATPase subunit
MTASTVNITAQGLNVSSHKRRSILQKILHELNGDTSTRRQIRILKDVTFDVPGPSLTAIIGPSGSGKTTLLNALSGRCNGLGTEITGEVSVIGDGSSGCGANITARDVAYVKQDDHLEPLLTVRETLEYAAALCPSHIEDSERAKLVKHLIGLLRLDGCADIRIGDGSRKGCSGGEIRRTSIGIQILKRQPVLFLDEPTTGLDPASTIELLRVLNSLVCHRTTVILTLHQPRSEAWALLDNIVLMSQGSVLYAGNTPYSLDHFANGGFTLSHVDNPFDFVTDLIAMDTRSKSAEEESRARIRRLRMLWTSCNMDKSRMQVRSGNIETSHTGDEIKFGPRFWQLLVIHCRRALTVALRDRLGVIAILLEGVSMGLALGTIFYQLSDDLPGIRSRQGALYCACSMQSYLVCLYETYRLTTVMDAYDREIEDRAITPLVFYLSRRFARFVLEDAVTPLTFSASFYFMAGLQLGTKEFFSFYLIQLLLHLISLNVATLCSASTRDFMRAGLFANMNYAIQCLCAGLLINLRSLTPPIRWIQWVTYLVRIDTLQFSMASDLYSDTVSVHCAAMSSLESSSTVQSQTVLQTAAKPIRATTSWTRCHFPRCGFGRLSRHCAASFWLTLH